MKSINPFFLTDGYKTGHYFMYPKGTQYVYNNLTARSNKYAVNKVDYVISFGIHMMMKEIHDIFEDNFFKRQQVAELANRLQDGHTPEESLALAKEYIKHQVCSEIRKEYSLYLNTDYDVSHIEELWDLGYLPIEVKALPEGTKVPIKIPLLTIENTLPQFFWLPNFLETVVSMLIWKPMTSATIAYNFKKNLVNWAMKTDKENLGFVDFQAHDFSMRGMDSDYAVAASGLGHALLFLGSDSLPVIPAGRYYYDIKGGIVHSVNATEHSVMCAGTRENELETFKFLMEQFPTGILSIVSDTWNFWDVLTKYLPVLKDAILKRDGKIVIRPDSGDPVDIICGTNSSYEDLSEDFKDTIPTAEYFEDLLLDEVREETPHGECGPYEYEKIYRINGKLYKAKIHNIQWNRYDKQYYFIEMYDTAEITLDLLEEKPEDKGTIEILWDIFGGTINDQGYKVLDPHIGAIYGDSINLERQEQICARLAKKGFASTNIVFGIGSFTYQYNTRDNHGFAVKATYVEIKNENGEIEKREIYKDPITDDGRKKSARGLLQVVKSNGKYILNDQVSKEEKENSLLKTVYKNGNLVDVSFDDIKNNVKKELEKELNINNKILYVQ